MQRKLLARLRKLCDPLALCYHIGEALDYGRKPCAHDFRHTREFFRDYAPTADVEAIIALLVEMGVHCDCEIGFNICPETGA